MNKQVVIVLPLEKETKGALLYRDQTIGERDPLYVADGLYLRKAGVLNAKAPGSIGYPKKIKITIEFSED